MGGYLSCLNEPITDKFSTDEANNKLNCGTSTMQGWRDNQEDAHNCILDYDEDTSYFAVYDGHGGMEVAKYTSECLPDFLKELEDYKNGKLEKALEDGFLKFDATLVSKEVGIKLKEYREVVEAIREKQEAIDHADWYSHKSDSEEEEENVKNLYEEANMPLEKVIEKYKAQKILSIAAAMDKNSDSSPNISTSTSIIPESSKEAVSSSSNVICSKSDNSNNDDEGPVSSGSQSKDPNKVKCGETKNESKVDSPDSSGDTKEECMPSDDTNSDKIGNQNGVKPESTQNCESTKSDVTSSSTVAVTPQENGEVVKKGKGKALTKTKGVVSKPELRPKRTAHQYYKSIVSMEEYSEEESEDEKDETFEGQNDDSSDEDDNGDEEEDEDEEDDEEEEEDEEEDDAEEEEKEVNNQANAEDNSDETSTNDKIESESEDEDSTKRVAAGTGCTAVVAVLKGYDLYVANAGDSRCVVCRNGKAVEMSFDHKPQDDRERKRIVQAGGYISYDGRVNGGLNLSRALGDFYEKGNKELSDREQAITALPDVKTLKIKPGEDEFMIVACDGIWNCMSSQEAVDYVRVRMQEGREKLSQICEELFDHCLAPYVKGDGTGNDNMTAIIVEFKTSSLKRPSTEPEPNEAEHCKRIKVDEPQVSTKI